MDTLKDGTHSYDNEKGHSEAPPIRSESSPGAVQPERACCRQSKRALIIFGTVALAWLLLSCTKRAFNQQHHVWHWATNEVEPVSSTAEECPNHCVNSTGWTTYYEEPSWTVDYPFGAEATFSLPLDSDAFFLTSRGPFQYGAVDIGQSSEVSDTVDVRVRVAYRDDEALQHATVCRLARLEKEQGVEIITQPIKPHRHQRFPHDPLRFDVSLTLPAGDNVPLSVKKLETSLPNYNQNVADLGQSILFDKISLGSANGQLSVQSVACNDGQFSMLNGDIDGRFSARSSLSLNTLNGHITPNVTLLACEGKDSPKLAIHSVNGQIAAEISLSSGSPVGGEFDIDAALRNGDIALKFADTPVDSVVRCRAETTAGKIEVNLDRAFEGTYSLQSLLGKKTVSQRDVEDPAEKGRRRAITQSVAFGQLEGEIRWIESDGSSSKNEGYVVLKALTAPVNLVV